MTAPRTRVFVFKNNSTYLSLSFGGKSFKQLREFSLKHTTRICIYFKISPDLAALLTDMIFDYFFINNCN